MHFGQHSAASGGLAYSSVSPGAYYRPTYTASNWSGLGSDSRYGIGSRNFSYKPEDRWKNYTPTPAPENGLFHSREDVKSYLAGPRRMENTSGASHLHQSATYQTHRKERLTTDISRPVHSNYISQSILKASVANPPTASETVLHRARESSLQTQPKKSGNDFQGSSSFAGNPSGQPSYGEGHFSRYDSQPSLVNGRSTGYSASDQKAPIRLATEKSSTERMSHHRLDKPPVSNSISQNQSASRAPVPVSKMASNSASGKSVDYQVTCSNERSGGAVEAFGICTTQGIIKTVNEDGVSVIMNVNSPDTSHKYSYFAVFDGHGGHQCVNYLKDQLHLKVLNDPAFPNSIDKAIFNGVIKAEKEFLGVQPSDKSGACCLIIIFKDNDCYIGNVGDCRAVMSSHHGKRDIQITIDHKPESELETERIKKAGGYIYKKTITTDSKTSVGPYRIVPGKLSVARTIGDIRAKHPQYGGNPNVIIPDPDIFMTRIDQSSDGIFDKLSSKRVIEIAWQSIKKHHGTPGTSVHQLCRFAAEAVIVAAIESRSSDNLTCLVLGLPGLLNFANQQS